MSTPPTTADGQDAGGDAGDGQRPAVAVDRRRQVRRLAEREFQTVLRTPLYWLLAAGSAALVAGLTLLGGASGYLPLVLDLLTPLSALIPVLAFAFGYRAILGDRERGELETLRTYPLSKYRFVLGVYLGRAGALLAVVVGSLLVAGLVVALTDPGRLEQVAVHATVDSPLVFLRLLVLAALFALVALSAAVAASAAARSGRSGLVLATLSVVALVVGLDALLVGGLTTGVLPADLLTTLTALSPTSAFRGLVFGLAVRPVGALEVPTGPGVLASGLGLLAWLVGGLWLAARLSWRA